MIDAKTGLSLGECRCACRCAGPADVTLKFLDGSPVRRLCLACFRDHYPVDGMMIW